MRKKRWLLLGLLVACSVGVVLAVLALLPSRPGITKENFYRIQDGMTRAEVEEIFGGKANGRVPYLLSENVWEDETSGDSAIAYFDANGRVVAKDWFCWPDDRTVWQKMLDRLPWREKPQRTRLDVL